MVGFPSICIVQKDIAYSAFQGFIFVPSWDILQLNSGSAKHKNNCKAHTTYIITLSLTKEQLRARAHAGLPSSRACYEKHVTTLGQVDTRYNVQDDSANIE